MKRTLVLLMIVSALFACHKKSVPAGSPTAASEIPPVVTTRVATARAMIIVTGDGKIVTPKNQLPQDAGITADYSRIARAFTPEQKANLTLRYKTVPPKVIYVADMYTQKSLKGIYCVYKKKFWYWKKEDGLFYLDDTYYK